MTMNSPLKTFKHNWVFGEPNDIYFDFQEELGRRRNSSSEELSEYSSHEEEYYDEDGMVSLEEEPQWALELLHYWGQSRFG
jgi:hypothetical protein